jgi:chemotaxis protein methyltransferase CheR
MVFFQKTSKDLKMQQQISGEAPIHTHREYPWQVSSANIIEEVEIVQKDDHTSEEQMRFIRMYANQGKIDMAIHTCKKAIAADKLNPSLHYLYATVLQENNKLDEAVTSLKHAVYLDPNFVLSYYSLGKIYQRLGNVQGADKCTEIVMTILNTYSQNEVLFESEGLTAGRFKEMIMAADQTRDLV